MSTSTRRSLLSAALIMLLGTGFTAGMLLLGVIMEEGPSRPPLPAEAPVKPGPSRLAIDPGQLADLPTRPVELWRKDQAAQTCSGPTVYAFLQSAGVVPAEGKPDFLSAVVIEARDGFSVLFSMGELDPVLRESVPVLATHCTGVPLDPDQGPVLLVVPDDRRRSRRIRQVTSVRLVSLR
jgi:hypothetical protein